MLSLTELYTIEYVYYLLGFMISILTFYGGVSLILKLKEKALKRPGRVIAFTSILLGVAQYTLNLLFNLSLNAPISMKGYVLHAILLILLSSLFSYIIIKNVLYKSMKPHFHLSGGALVTGGILITLSLGNIVFFSESISIQPIHFILSSIIIFAYSFCIVRFLLLLNLSDNQRYYKTWLVIGSLAAGIAFSFLPYLLFFGMVDQTLFLKPEATLESYLIALAFNFVCM